MAEAPETRPTLLVRLRDPDAGAAWSQFVEIYAPLLYGFARKKGLQDADAADVTQEALRAVAQALPRLEYDPQRGCFRAWLFTVVRSKLAAFRHRQGRQPLGSGDPDQLALLHEQPAPESDEEQVWRQDYRQHLFNWAAAQVRPAVEATTWQAFWQTAALGRRAREVAAGLGLTVSAVYMARSRVLARIKAQIAQVQGESADE
jgi:RNA polymerase sigma-70 factor (ECF subfamily)